MAGPRSFVRKDNVPAITIPSERDGASRDDRLRIQNIKERLERIEATLRTLGTDIVAIGQGTNNGGGGSNQPDEPMEETGLLFVDMWDASGGMAPSESPENNTYWIVEVAGTLDLDAEEDVWNVGDWAVYVNDGWHKAGTNIELVQDSIGMAVTDTATLNLTYADGPPTITGDVLDSPLLGGQNSAYHLARANHTGTQTASTISDFEEATEDFIAGALVGGTDIDVTYNDVAGTITLDYTGSGGSGMSSIADGNINTAGATTSIAVPSGSWRFIDLVIVDWDCSVDFSPFMQFNTDTTGANYQYGVMAINASTDGSAADSGNSTPGGINLHIAGQIIDSGNTGYSLTIRIYNPADTTRIKRLTFDSVPATSDGDGEFRFVRGGGVWGGTAAITTIELFQRNTSSPNASAGSSVTATNGTWALYGYT